MEHPWLRRSAAIIALALALAAPAVAQELDDDEGGADGDPDARLWKEPCDLDGKGRGELLRVSGSTTGANMSSGHETYRVQLGDAPLVELTQQGDLMFGGGAEIAEGARWKVSCGRGAIRILSGDAEVRLSVDAGAARIDAKWMKALAADRAKDQPLQRLQQVAGLLDAMEDEPAVAGRDEAGARVRLLIAERALDAGETDEADAALANAKVERFPALGDWARRITGRLDAARGAAPLAAVKAKRLGTLQALPPTPAGPVGEGESEQAPPGLFWLRASLCVRQEGAQSRSMRCYDAATGRWSGVEPYVSPFDSGPRLTATYLGHPGRYATRLALQEAGGERAIGEFGSPRLLARDLRGGLVVRSTNPTPSASDAVAVEGYDASRGVGSALAGGGKYFFDGATTLRSITQLGRSWSLPAPGRGAGVVCVAPPLTSPDEKRAACLASKDPAEKARAPYELWIFELVDAAR